MYKCIPVAFGTDISVNKTKFFHFDIKTHAVVDLQGNKVAIQRRIDDLYELYNEPVSNFTDVNGAPVASTVQQLTDYLSAGAGKVKAGEGISIVDSTASVLAGGPSTLGGYKVGTGLMVDGDGKLSATASSEVTKVLNNEAEMLGLNAEPLRPYRVIRLDTKRLYFLNAGSSPAVLANWFTGPSLETTVLSFKGRTGAVDTEFGDYNFDLIPLVDKTTAATHKWVIDAGKLYVENITTLERKEITYASDLMSLQASFNTLNGIVTNPSTGLVKKLGDVEQKTAAIDSVVNNSTTGLTKKVADLEARPVGVASFNGRTGAIAPQSGDYVTDQVSETVGKRFVSTQQIADWDAKETTTGSQAKATAVKTYADATFIAKAEKGKANGVAPLDSGSKVPVVNLPVNVPSGIAPLGTAGKVPAANLLTNVAGGVPLLNVDAKVEAQYIQTGTASGVAPLGSASKVPMTYILTNTPGGLPILDAGSRVTPANLPTFLPQSKRIWRDETATKVKGIWYPNTSGNEMEVHITSNNANDGGYVNVLIRENDAGTVFNIVGNSTSNVAGGASSRSFCNVTVPAGWQYALSSPNLGTRTVASWYELS